MIDFKAICRNKTDRCHEDCNVCAYFVTTEQSDIRQVYQQGRRDMNAEWLDSLDKIYPGYKEKVKERLKEELKNERRLSNF